MSDALKPAMHGRDHVTGGSDPIPNLGSTNDWILVEHLSVSAASDTGYPTVTPLTVDFDDSGIGGRRWVTAFDSTFTSVSSAVQVNAAGTYRVHVSAVWSTASITPGVSKFASVEPVVTGGAHISSNFILGPDRVVLDSSDNRSWVTTTGIIMWVTSAPASVYATIWQNSGSTLLADVALWIERVTVELPTTAMLATGP